MPKKIIQILYIISVFLVTLSTFASCIEAFYEYPEPLVGQTTVTLPYTSQSSQKIFYDGLGANEVIYNSDPNDLYGFDKATAQKCAGLTDLTLISTCFLPDSVTAPFSLMHSKTSRDGTPQVEIAAIVYNLNTANGDIYSPDNSLMSNFALWGKNLNLNSGASNATWNLSGYTLNPDAQSSYSSSQKDYYDSRINELSSEAEEINTTAEITSNYSWNLQGSSLSDSTNADAGKFPEGKIWHVAGDLVLSGPHYYSGHGTIVIDSVNGIGGTLTLLQNAKLLPKNSDASLGLIIRGKSSSGYGLMMQPDTKIQAAVFATYVVKPMASATTTVARNIYFIGSFVASGFTVPATAMNVSFIYDFHLSGNWPPGFRYFNMPVASEQ